MSKLIPAQQYCIKVFDGTHDTPKPVPMGYPLITSKNILGRKLNLQDTYYISQTDYLSVQKRSAVSKWDILFSMIGSIGETYLEKNDNIPYAIKNVGVFSCNDEYKSKWLYYYLMSPYAKTFINNYLAGAVQKFLGLGTLREFPIIPYDESKKKKVDLLYAIDSKIELNNKINTELEAMAKTLYDYWFVQLDFPNKNGKPYKSSGGEMMWSEELKKYIPEGWKVNKVCDLIAKDKSGDWGKDEQTGNYTQEVFCIRGADINGLNGKEQCEPPKRYILKKNDHKLLKPYDLIIEISGGSPSQSTGRIAHISPTTAKRFSSPLICSNFCKAITLKDYKLTYNFHFFWERLYDNKIFFGYEGKTSGIKNFLFDSFANTNYIIIPDDQTKDKFFDFMESTEQKRQKILDENQKLIDFRDWLLPMLMNGQIKIK